MHNEIIWSIKNISKHIVDFSSLYWLVANGDILFEALLENPSMTTPFVTVRLDASIEIPTHSAKKKIRGRQLSKSTDRAYSFTIVEVGRSEYMFDRFSNRFTASSTELRMMVC